MLEWIPLQASKLLETDQGTIDVRLEDFKTLGDFAMERSKAVLFDVCFQEIIHLHIAGGEENSFVLHIVACQEELIP